MSLGAGPQRGGRGTRQSLAAARRSRQALRAGAPRDARGREEDVKLEGRTRMLRGLRAAPPSMQQPAAGKCIRPRRREPIGAKPAWKALLEGALQVLPSKG